MDRGGDRWRREDEHKIPEFHVWCVRSDLDWNSPELCLTLLQLGAKKGLGAQKVSSKSFSEVEKQAQVAEKLREEQAVEAKKQAEESM